MTHVVTDEQQAVQAMALDVADRELGPFASHCPTEPDAGAAASLEASARSEANACVFDGGKVSISGGGRRDLYLVMARTGGAGTEQPSRATHRSPCRCRCL